MVSLEIGGVLVDEIVEVFMSFLFGSFIMIQQS